MLRPFASPFPDISIRHCPCRRDQPVAKHQRTHLYGVTCLALLQNGLHRHAGFRGVSGSYLVKQMEMPA